MRALMLTLALTVTLTLAAQRGAPPQTGVLAGQVNTPEGRPASGVRVAAMAVPEPNAPAGTASTLVSIGQTDAAGRYRLEAIPAGRYYIVAGQVEFPTYYPGVATVTEATPVPVAAASGAANLALNFALSSANQDGAIEITVTSAGAPLRGAQLTLRGPASGASIANANTLGAVTDAAGQGAFRNLAPGQYAIQAQLDGYLGTLPAGYTLVSTLGAVLAAPTASSASLTISPRQPPQRISLILNRGAAISGTITDFDNTPVVGLRVNASILGYANGRRTLSTQKTAVTDDRGQYRLFWFGPGEYYITAESTPQRGLATSIDAYPSTYYPGTTDISAAKPAVVRNSDGASGLDFKMQRVKNYRVTGKVLNPPARTLPNGQVDQTVPTFAYTSRDPNVPDSSLAPPLIQNRVRSDTGEFDIMVPAGEWNLFAVINQPAPTRGAPGTTGVLGGVVGAAGTVIALPNATRYISGRAPIKVVDKDLDGVTIRLSSQDIKGRVVMPVGGPALPNGIPLQQIRPSLLPRESIPTPLITASRLAQPLGPNGEFEFPGVPPGKYSIQMAVPAPAYIADIRVGTKSIFNDGILTVGDDALGPVEIILGSGAVSLQGTVMGITPETTVGQLTSARIVLAPSPPRRQNSSLYRTTSLGNLTGQFFLGGIAPGEYKIFVLSGLPAGAEQDPDVVARYEDRGTPITITAGQNTAQNVQVNWTPIPK